MNIKALKAHEILDSRGTPTILCSIILENGQRVNASVPSGKSKGLYECRELRDNDTKRYEGNGVLQAIKYIENVIAPLLVGHQPNVLYTDNVLCDLPRKTGVFLGSNTTLAVSICVARAASVVAKTSLYDYFATVFDCAYSSQPYPLFNLLNGGAHANNNLVFQEVLLIPVKDVPYPVMLEQAVRVYHRLARVLDCKGYATTLGDEGGYAPIFLDTSVSPELEAVLLLKQAIQESRVEEDLFRIGFDVAASSFYSPENDRYIMRDTYLHKDALLELYASFSKDEGIMLFEDPFAENDWSSWSSMVQTLSSEVIIAGDDLLATNIDRLKLSIDHKACNGVIIKPNQVGTVSEAIQTVSLSKDHTLYTIASHRSGETNDSFIADFAYAFGLNYIKAGAPARGERVAKYNRLLEIFNHNS